MKSIDEIKLDILEKISFYEQTIKEVMTKDNVDTLTLADKYYALGNINSLVYAMKFFDENFTYDISKIIGDCNPKEQTDVSKSNITKDELNMMAKILRKSTACGAFTAIDAIHQLEDKLKHKPMLICDNPLHLVIEWKYTTDI